MNKLGSQWIQATVAIVVVGIIAYNGPNIAKVISSGASGYAGVVKAFYNVSGK